MLMDYWQHHPLASDTADGIQRWWLAGAAGVSVGALTGALAWLADVGLVQRAQAADGRTRFRRSGVPFTALPGDHPGSKQPD